MKTKASESESLKLLTETQTELRGLLNALGGRQSDGLLETYTLYSAAHVNRAVEGYLYLRQNRRYEASKHLIRTAIEAMIRLKAIGEKPDLLFRIAFTEFKEDRKWVGSLQIPNVADALKRIEADWTRFVRKYRAKYRDHPCIEKELSIKEAADCAGVEGYYNSHYRLYCRFTHAAFRASSGYLAGFEGEDNRAMMICTLAAVEALLSFGVPAPCVEALKQRAFGNAGIFKPI